MCVCVHVNKDFKIFDNWSCLIVNVFTSTLVKREFCLLVSIWADGGCRVTVYTGESMLHIQKRRKCNDCDREGGW